MQATSQSKGRTVDLGMGKCPYLVKKNQTANWKPDSKIVAQIKQKIESNKRLCQMVKHFQDTKILEDAIATNNAMPSDESNAETSSQKSKLRSGLVATS